MNTIKIDQTMIRRSALVKIKRVAVGLSLLTLLLLPPLATAAEWSAPPGINIANQERVLKERVIQQARSRLGDDLMEVIVHVGYVRMDAKEISGAPGRVKLPGFNSFIIGSKPGDAEIISEFMRVRQVFVIVADTMAHRPDALARDLGSSVGLELNRGDSIRVVTVTRGLAEARPLPNEPNPKQTEIDEPILEEANEGLRPLAPEPPVDPLKEAQSTVYLMKARRSYFTGDFQTALDQILQSIAVNPRSAQAYAMLGSLYYAMNWKNLAIKYWERSLQIDPTNREIEDLVTQIRVGRS